MRRGRLNLGKKGPDRLRENQSGPFTVKSCFAPDAG
jgi:hypothetical protein